MVAFIDKKLKQPARDGDLEVLNQLECLNVSEIDSIPGLLAELKAAMSVAESADLADNRASIIAFEQRCQDEQQSMKVFLAALVQIPMRAAMAEIMNPGSSVAALAPIVSQDAPEFLKLAQSMLRSMRAEESSIAEEEGCVTEAELDTLIASAYEGEVVRPDGTVVDGAVLKAENQRNIAERRRDEAALVPSLFGAMLKRAASPQEGDETKTADELVAAALSDTLEAEGVKDSTPAPGR